MIGVPYLPDPTKKECDVCGTLISINAKVCPTCKIPLLEYKDKCCDIKPRADAKVCKKCGRPLGPYKPCVACRQPIPRAATACSLCKVEQNWVRRTISISTVTLALLVALASAGKDAAISIVHHLERHSNTTFTFGSATTEKIVVYLSNAGRSRSKILGSRLEFGEVPVENRDLELVPGDLTEGHGIVEPGDRVIGLTCAGLRSRRKNPDVAGRYTRDEITEPLPKYNVNLIITVRESDGRDRVLKASVAAEHLRDFILSRIPDHDNP